MDDVLLDMVDFTWLRAGGGWWVNLLRPQSDSTCIDDCLQRALRSDSELLRERSIELLGLAACLRGVPPDCYGMRIERLRIVMVAKFAVCLATYSLFHVVDF